MQMTYCWCPCSQWVQISHFMGAKNVSLSAKNFNLTDVSGYSGGLCKEDCHVVLEFRGRRHPTRMGKMSQLRLL